MKLEIIADKQKIIRQINKNFPMFSNLKMPATMIPNKEALKA
jgi:hypothetical protein